MDRQKILVVDDEERMRKLVRDFLFRDGFDVLEAGDGEEALELFDKQEDISLIILDVMMPKLDGWETAKEIRRDSKVPIIMLTAKSDESDELRGFDVGIDEYVTKPFSPRTLVARVEAILRRTVGTPEDRIEIAGIVVDKAAHTVTIDGQQRSLAPPDADLQWVGGIGPHVGAQARDEPGGP